MGRGFVFVKTKWLKNQLMSLFGVSAHLIPPTIDETLFYPEDIPTGRVHICAMVRVLTPRRNPLQTLQILADAMREYGSQNIAISIFGTDDSDLKLFLDASNVHLSILDNIDSRGVIDRESVARLSRRCHIFLDYSSWQAFGRSGLEAMASGCIPILPESGGANEYAIHGQNSLLVDTRNNTAGMKAIRDIMKKKYDLSTMRKQALATAKKFSIAEASKITVGVFRDFLSNRTLEKMSVIKSVTKLSP
mmetsp:Transcript_39418/g.80632  ORF Transcript_39418/g.80632 Transcript_39418/m.80632 type:complete len:248 (-) Transcript_39418:492-1235(-)